MKERRCRIITKIGIRRKKKRVSVWGDEKTPKKKELDE